MPMFQVDGGRPVAARSVRPADAAYGASVVDEHLGTLLGEHLLPVRVRNGAAEEPYLLAVDVHGRPVVVEVVGLLDGPTLLRALAFLGRASRLSMRDLAARYHGGTQRFSADLATFRESVPAVRLVPGGGASRLLVVCATVGEGMIDVVEALDDRGIDVLRVGLLDGPGGRLVDVSPVHLSAPDGSWSVSGGVATLAAHGPVQEGFDGEGEGFGGNGFGGNGFGEDGFGGARIGEPPDEDTLSQLPTRAHVVTRVPTGIRFGSAVPSGVPAPAAVVTDPPSVLPATQRQSSDGHGADPYQQALAATQAVPGQSPPADATPAEGVPTWSPVRPFLASAPGYRAEGDGAVAPEPAAAGSRPTPSPAPSATPAPSTPPTAPVPSAPPAAPAPSTPPAANHRREPAPAGLRLAALAADGPVVLVWHRHRRNTYHEALVHEGGEIELSDGTRVSDPSAAAEIASASSVPVDGWRVWRVGSPQGPALGEVC